MSYMSYMGNSYGNAGMGGQNGFSGTSYQPQQQFAPQTANYGLKMGIQFASQAEMEALIVPPNTQIMALGKEGDVFYVKSVDNLGRSNLKIYDFKERVSGEVKQEFATRNEIVELSQKILVLETKLAELNKPIEEIKE